MNMRSSHYQQWLLFLFSFILLIKTRITSASAVMSLSWPNRPSKLLVDMGQRVHVYTRSSFDRMIENVFDKADVNNDGKINFQECYSLVMKLYVYLNRQAPVPPPTRHSLRALFEACDENNSNCISKTEFTNLSHILGRRAFFRVATCKLVRIAGAPILAEYTMRQLDGRTWPKKVAKAMVPKSLRPKMLPVVTSPAFGRTILIVAFVSTLGNAFVGGVNYVLHQSLPGQEEEI